MDRTLKIKGIIASNAQVEATVKIDGTVVYSGPITVDPTDPYSSRDNNTSAVNVATWTELVTFAGTRALEITATKGSILYCQTNSTYMPLSLKSDPTALFSSGVNDVACYSEETADGISHDPNSNVTINGVPVSKGPSATLNQWHWQINEGDVLTATLNIQAGLTEPSVFDNNKVFDTTYSTGDGATVDFTGPPYNTNTTNILKVTVDSTVMEPNTYNAKVVNGVRTITFNAPPAAGANIRIDIVQFWDPTLKSYYGYE